MIPLGDLCISASCRVDSIHAGHFLVSSTITSSIGSSDCSSSSLGCSGEHAVSSIGPSCYSSSLESMESSIDLLKEIFSSKVTSLLISTFC